MDFYYFPLKNKQNIEIAQNNSIKLEHLLVRNNGLSMKYHWFSKAVLIAFVISCHRFVGNLETFESDLRTVDGDMVSGGGGGGKERGGERRNADRWVRRYSRCD